ncbi:hypothetical protein [Serratia oryzae]|uniref:Uncharacterized protein n=1 Tax=Serratia oryzae TaxID=2034155 RepID=A0A1S8CPK7_9GAMM|nr:hypothetical protein [Serratia oryzae]OMQ27032.1 hypothetical protein BMI79_01505 [Serratia oryzae]
MNYQVAPFWFYSGKIVLMVFLAIGLALFGINALVFYCLLAGLVIPVATSMRLHQLAQKGLVVIPKEHSQWTVYVQGIPVQETRSVLTNPCFAFQEHLHAFFLRAFVVKFIIQAGTGLMLIFQLWHQANWWILGLGVVAAFGVLLKCVDSAKTLLSIVRHSWGVEKVTTQKESLWYRASFNRQGQPVAALQRLLAF